MSHDKKAYRIVSPATAGAMLFGAVMGGVASAAANARKVKAGAMPPREAALSALREAGTTGLAAGAGVAAMSALRLGGVVGLIGIAAVATGAKYMLDNVLDEVLAKGKACCAAKEASPASETPAAKTTAATKTTAKPAAKSAVKSAKPKPAKAAPKPEHATAE
jgi:hypothetical protein